MRAAWVLTYVTCAAALAVVPAAFGQAPGGPATQPAPGGPRGWRGGPDAAPDASPWEVVEQFLQENSPRRLRAAESNDLPPEIRRRWRVFVAARYQALQRLARENMPLYEKRLQMLRAEDEIWGLGADYAVETDPQRRQQVREALRARIAELQEAGLKERHDRLTLLQEELRRLRQQWEEDTRNAPRVVDERVERILARPGELLPPEWTGPPRPRPGPIAPPDGDAP